MTAASLEALLPAGWLRRLQSAARQTATGPNTNPRNKALTIPLSEHTIELRVRYNETDAMGLLHHSNYLAYFEVGRTELFRAQGGSYRRMEELGLFFVVARINVRFKKPARYDDVLALQTRIKSQSPAKLVHEYRLLRGDELLTEAESVIACVNSQGEVQAIPDDLTDLTRM